MMTVQRHDPEEDAKLPATTTSSMDPPARSPAASSEPPPPDDSKRSPEELEATVSERSSSSGGVMDKTDTTTASSTDVAAKPPPAAAAAAAASTDRIVQEGESILADANRVDRFKTKVPSTPVGPDTIGVGHKPGAFHVVGGFSGAFAEEEESQPPLNAVASVVTPTLETPFQAVVVPDNEDPEAFLQQYDNADDNNERAARADIVVNDDDAKPAEEQRALSKWARYGMLCACLVVFGIVAVVLGVTVGGGGGNGGDDPANNNTNTDGSIVPDEGVNVGDNCFSKPSELTEALDNYLVDSGPDTTTAQAYGNLTLWCVSDIENFEGVFSADRNTKTASFNEPLSGWNVGVGTRFVGMFRGAGAFNQDLSMWNVSMAMNLNSMFAGASSFNQNLCAWGAVLPEGASVSGMFSDTSCPVVSDPDLQASPPGPFCHQCS